MIRASYGRIAANEFAGMIRAYVGRIATNEFVGMIRPYVCPYVCVVRSPSTGE